MSACVKHGGLCWSMQMSSCVKQGAASAESMRCGHRHHWGRPTHRPQHAASRTHILQCYSAHAMSLAIKTITFLQDPCAQGCHLSCTRHRAPTAAALSVQGYAAQQRLQVIAILPAVRPCPRSCPTQCLSQVHRHHPGRVSLLGPQVAPHTAASGACTPAHVWPVRGSRGGNRIKVSVSACNKAVLTAHQRC